MKAPIFCLTTTLVSCFLSFGAGADELPSAAPIAGTGVIKALETEDPVDAADVADADVPDNNGVEAALTDNGTDVTAGAAAAVEESQAPNADEAERIADEYQEQSAKLDAEPATPREESRTAKKNGASAKGHAAPAAVANDNPTFISPEEGLTGRRIAFASEPNPDAHKKVSGAKAKTAAKPSHAAQNQTVKVAMAMTKKARLSPETVRSLQAALAKDAPGVAVDGVFGKNTRTALLSFQRRHGLKASGEADQATLEKLAVVR